MGGIGQMLTFAYMVGGWVKANAYVSKILETSRKKVKLNNNFQMHNNQVCLKIMKSFLDSF